MDLHYKNQLFAHYPKLFPERINIACDNGWYQLISSFCYNIQVYIVANHLEQNTVMVIKEKFGGLRIYLDKPVDNFVTQLLGNAEDISFNICEICGSNENVETKDIGGYIKTWCDKCQEANK